MRDIGYYYPPDPPSKNRYVPICPQCGAVDTIIITVTGWFEPEVWCEDGSFEDYPEGNIEFEAKTVKYFCNHCEMPFRENPEVMVER